MPILEGLAPAASTGISGLGVAISHSAPASTSTSGHARAKPRKRLKAANVAALR